MKNLRKVMVLIMAIMVVFAFSTMAFGADGDKNDSITVTGAKVGETYNLYKLFDLSVNDEAEPTAYTYTVNSAWAAFFAAADEEAGTAAGPGAEYVTINEAGAVTAISDAAALAKAAAAWENKPAATDTATVGEGETTVEFSELPDGYWLITSTLGTIAMTETTPDASEVTINEKNPEDTIEKTVKEGTAYGESNDAQIGDLVEFQSTVKIVKGTRNVVVHDKMSDGLTYKAESVAIAGLTKGTEYTVNESPSDGDTFDITFDQAWIDELDFGEDGYNEYVITYTATINENAVVKGADGVAIVDANNKTYVSFGDGTKSTEDSTTTTTHKFSVFKHAKGSEDNLAGAEFQLKKAGTVLNLIKIDDNNYRIAMPGEVGAVNSFITVEEGDIVIWGVDADDDYTLYEKTAPTGYNPLTEEVDVTVNAANTTRADVENNSGSELPSTGGVGTTIFYVLGVVLVAGCGVVLVSRKRMNNK